MNDTTVLTVSETAARLRIHPGTVRLWLRGRRIHGVYMGSDKAGWRIAVAEVDRVLREGPRPAQPEAGAPDREASKV